MECIVHYDNQKIYSAVKSLSEINLERIKQAKEKRLKIGGINSYKEKCDQIPVNIDTENDVNIPSKPVDVHKEPTKIKGNNVSYHEEVEIQVNWKYFVWVYSRKQNGFIPSFKSWSIQMRSNPIKIKLVRPLKHIFHLSPRK